MREILFRGKRVDNGEWSYGSLLIQSGEWLSNEEPAPDESWIYGKQGEHYLVILETVGQFTGLTDKNGRKIFEGDICRFDNGEPNESERYTNYAVQWDCVNSQWHIVENNNCEDCLDIFFCKRAKVIGNIYDNPDLLEVEE